MNHWCHAYGTKVTGVTRLGVSDLPGLAAGMTDEDICPSVGCGAPQAQLDLEHVTFTGYQLVEHWIDEESDEESGDQAGDYHNGKRSLGV